MKDAIKLTLSFFLLFIYANPAISQVNESDSLELVNLYNATCNEGCDLDWDLNTPADTWDTGISFTNSGRVNQIDLSGRNLSGNIPDLNLPLLHYLLLYNNNLTGSIPSLDNLTKLTQLNLEFNDLSGCFPEDLLEFCSYNFRFGGNPDLAGGGDFSAFCNDQFGSCNYVYVNESDSLALVELYTATCNSCDLAWDFNTPVAWWSNGIEITNGNVTSLILYNKELTGTLPDLNLPNLVELDLSWNNLSGNIPDFTYLSSLEILELSNNNFSGSVPLFTTLTNIQSIRITTNNLTGDIPDWSGLSQLNVIRLYENQLSGCFPAWLSDFCGDGKSASFAFNDDLPDEGAFTSFCDNNFGSCAYVYVDPSDSLAIAELYNTTCINNCNLIWDLEDPLNIWDSGILLDENGRITQVSLIYNGLEGNIPDFNLPELTTLELYNNNLNGTIPDFSNMPKLTTLELNQNDFTGSIPSFEYMPDLEVANLRYNQLSGCFSEDLREYCGNSEYDFWGNPDLPGYGDFGAFCVNDFGTCEYVYVNPDDSLALAELYTATCNEGCYFTWDLNDRVNNWTTSLTFVDGRVTEIDLRSENLSGSLPDLNLPELQKLLLYNNDMVGDLPPFTHTANLEIIELGYNDFTGTLPDLNHLTNLTKFTAQGNELSGCYPEWMRDLCTYPNLVSLSNNIAMPAEGNVSYFCSFDFGSCNYTYIHPDDSLQLIELYNSACGDGCTLDWNLTEPVALWATGIRILESGRLEGITLTYKELSGTLPDLNLPELTTLNLYGNDFTGSLPSFTGLPNLATLDLGYNEFSGCFPTTLTALCDIDYDFRYNYDLPGSGNFNAFCANGTGGCFPTNVSDSLELVKLYNANCGDGCTLDWDFNDYVNIWAGIVVVDSSVAKINIVNKNLTGDIPVLNLPELTELDLGINQLTGQIPDISGLPNLQEIYLNNNQLNDCFGDELNSLCSGVSYDFTLNPNLPGNGNFGDFCMNNFGSCNYVFVEPSDSLELVRFYNLACGDDCTLNWDLNAPVNYWEGLVLSDAGRITEIELRYESLTGQIPVLNLPELAVYDLYGNSFSGCYPEALSAVCDIDYNFNGNYNLPENGNLAYFCDNGNGSCLGIAPADSLELVRLYNATCNEGCSLEWDLNDYVYNWQGVHIEGGHVTYVVINSEGLSGNLPALNLPELTSLNLSNNNLIGLIPDMSGLPRLNSVYLGNNKLSGCFPAYLAGLCGTVSVYTTGNRHLPGSGDFSLFCNSGYGRCEPMNVSDSLELVKIYDANCNDDCTLTWDLNDPVANWESLMLLNGRVARIDIYDKGLSGELPALNLPELTVLWFDSNQLSGQLPDISNLPNLANINLQNNQFSDCFSDDLLSVCDLYYYDFSENSGLPGDGNFSAFCNSGFGTCNPTNAADSLELVNFYNTHCNSGCFSFYWDFEALVSTWQGVTLDEGRVTGLYVNYKNLSGNLSDINLPHLTSLDLQGNRFDSTLTDLSNVPNLTTLDLSHNDFTGTLTDFSNLPQLTSLDLSGNDLSGNLIDFSNLPDLEYFDIEANDLTGEVPDFANITKLQEFNASNNSLSGSIPFFANLPDLLAVKLSYNQLSGCFPDELVRLCDSNSSFSGNAGLPNNGNLISFCNGGLGGCVPFNQADSLELVNFYNATCPTGCYLNWDFEQPVRTWLGITISGSRVSEIDISSRNLSGNIPNINLPGLTSMVVKSNNNLDGAIPEFNLPQLQLLDLSYNSLSGYVPNFSNLSNLEELYLYYNELTGEIPNFSNLPKLEKLLISSNNLSGSIPDFDNFPELRQLNLSHNDLTGEIPGFTNLTNLEYISLRSNQLSGCFSADLIPLCDIDYDFSFNTELPDEGNFNSFCNNGLGSCDVIFSTDSLELVNFYSAACQVCDFTWDFNTPVSTWEGILTGNGRVIEISLPGRSLSGIIPDFNLPELIDLNLSYNNFTGGIPGFTDLTSLENINLRNNQLDGCFSTDLTHLCSVNFDFNGNSGLALGGNFSAFCLNGAGSCTPTNPSDSLELIALYNLTCNENCTLEWNLNAPVSTWEGIVTIDGRVNSIALSNEGLSGNIPDLNLPELIQLILSDNNLTGNIPVFTNLPNLQNINLSSNDLSGCFFAELNSLCSINYNFHSNPNLPLSGNFSEFCDLGYGLCSPTHPSDSLELVNFYNETCTDGCSLVWDFNNLVSSWAGVSVVDGRVKNVYLANKGLTGDIPNLNLPELTRLSLIFNELTGPVPLFPNLTQLEDLDLTNNLLSGCFSEELTNFCANGVTFRVYNNPGLPNNGDFTDFCAYGFGRCEFTNPQDSLELVDFYNTTCNDGCILEWDFNELVTSWVGITTVSDRVTAIDLPAKLLRGNLPNLNLPELTELALYNNKLTGSLPSFSNLTNLEQLDLSYNQFTGCIPGELSNLCNINADISYNVDLPGQGDFDAFCNSNFGLCAYVSESDSLALVNFYNTNCTQDCILEWDFNEPVYTWEGITALDNAVVEIELSDKGLSGTLPSFNFSQLQVLQLQSNDLTGEIPVPDNLPVLDTIDLSDNQFSGCFPDALSAYCDIDYDFRFNDGLPGNGNFTTFCDEDGYGICGFASPTDSLALIYFYEQSCNEDCTLSWDFSQPVVTWEGIFLNNDRVREIDLPGKGLSGQLPVLNLPELQTLNLANNQLSGCFKDSTIVFCNIGYNFNGNITPISNANFSDFCNGTWDGCSPVLQSDSLALVDFYNQTCNDDCTLNWDFNTPVNSWSGVFVTSGRVRRLDVIGKGLSDTIPDLFMSALEQLDLTGNQLSGPVPDFSFLPSLESLILYNNQLSGSIPNFNSLPDLQTLSLSNNQLSGLVPNFSNLPRLRTLYLGNNQLAGALPAFELPSLNYLSLANNQFVGCFPIEYTNYCDLDFYTFSGNPGLPENGNFDSFCAFGSGGCGVYVSVADSLQLVDMYNNNCNADCTLEWDFSEPVGFWEGIAVGFNTVRAIELPDKGLSGSLPDFYFPELIRLDLENNNLSGNITNYNMPQLQTLLLTKNNLSGSIPNFNLPQLKVISLALNKLSGTIPNFSLPKVEIINFSGNELEGNVPNFSHPKLREISLANNELGGTIPDFNLPYLVELNLNKNKLIGNLPELANSSVLTTYNVIENQLSGIIPDFGDRPALSLFLIYNNFSHEDIHTNFDANNAPTNYYLHTPQYFGNEQFHTDTIGATVTLSPDPSIPYENPSLRWVQNDEFITQNYTLNDTTYVIPSLDTADIGVYQYRFIDYTLSPEIEFYSRPINNYVEGLDLEGEPIIQGELILEYGINQSLSKIDSIRNELITEYGGVILDSCGCAVQLDLWKFGEDTLDVVRGIIGVDGTGDRRTSSTEIDGNRDNLFVPDYNEAEYILIGEPVENPNDTAKVVVGVVDTGINVYHNAVYDNLWRNQAEQNGMPGIDDDQNGYTDDIFGYDFITDSLMRDEHGHGTKVGGIITANTPQDMDIRVMPVRTFNDEGRGLLFDMLCGIYYAIDNGSDVINISAGYKGEKSVILQKALQYGRDRDVLFVVAAGNDTLDLNAINYWPAAFTRDTTLENTVITVTAVDSTYNLAEYASYGDTTVTIATSGQSILAPAEYDLESFDYIGGTSASTPIVSLALSIEKIKNPNKSRASLREGFLNNADIAADLIDVVEEGRMLNIETRLLSKLKVFLEGALLNPDGTYNTEMKTTLNNRGLLPGQTPLSPLATPTPPGQPYTATPWDYTGTEWGSTDYYLEDRVDWVLVSLRTERESASEIYRTAAQVKKDGTVEFYRPIMDLTGIADSVYIVVQHRNHMAVMSPEKVSVSRGRFVYDFTAEDSFRNPTAVGQVEVAPGVWAMIVGDSSQENDFPHYDINGDDKAIWVNENGNYDQYMSSDYDMNGDVNGNDKAIWSGKMGLSNRVPK